MGGPVCGTRRDGAPGLHSPRERKVLARENENLSQVVDLLNRSRKNEQRLGPLTAFRPDARERARRTEAARESARRASKDNPTR